MSSCYVWVNQGADRLSNVPTNIRAVISNFGFNFHTLNTHILFCVPPQMVSAIEETKLMI